MPASPNLIADAVVAAISGIATLTTLLPGVAVKRLKAPSLPPGVNPPLIVVVVGEMGAEGETQWLTAAHKLNKYPTTVVLITGGGSKLGDDANLREVRELIEDTIDDKRVTTFASVTGFVRVQTTGQAPFDTSVLPKGLNYSSQKFNVSVIEARAI